MNGNNKYCPECGHKNPNGKMTPKGRTFVSKHIRRHRRRYGYPPARASAAAYSEARRKGYKVPRRNPKHSKIKWRLLESFKNKKDAQDYARLLLRKNILTKISLYFGRWGVFTLARENAAWSYARSRGSSRPWEPAQKAPVGGRKRRTRNIRVGNGKVRWNAQITPGRLIGHDVVKIKTAQETIQPQGRTPLYGLRDGSVYVRGFFPNAPKGIVKEIWYNHDAKARREGYKVMKPWKHDFTRERVTLEKTRGGLIMRRRKKPLWGISKR